MERYFCQVSAFCRHLCLCGDVYPERDNVLPDRLTKFGELFGKSVHFLAPSQPFAMRILTSDTSCTRDVVLLLCERNMHFTEQKVYRALEHLGFFLSFCNAFVSKVCFDSSAFAYDENMIGTSVPTGVKILSVQWESL